MQRTCIETRMRLPWLVNGRLNSSETVESLDHVRSCHACMQELVFTAVLQQATHQALAAVPDSWLDHTWERLGANLGDPDAVQATQQPETSVVAALTAKLRAYAEPMVSMQRSTSAILRHLSTGLTGVAHDVTKWIVLALQA